MIAIEDVQLTPKRVHVGGNYLLRVKAYEESGGEPIPVPVVHVDFTAGLTDAYTGQVYRSYGKIGAMELTLPTIDNHTFFTIIQSATVRPESEEAYISLISGQYRATLSLRGNANLAGRSRDVTATIYAEDGTIAATATATDAQLGVDGDYILIIDGLTVTADGNCRLHINAPPLSNAPTIGFGQFLYGLDLYRMEKVSR